MPLFMVLSGYFSLRSYELSFRHVAQKKFLQLIVPCLSYYLIVCIPLWILQNVLHKDTSPLFRMFMDNLWFLKCLFLCYIVVWLSKRIFRYDGVAIAISIMASFAFPLINRYWHLSSMLPFFWIGYLMRRTNILDGKIKITFALSSIVFLLLLCFWNGNMTIYKTPNALNGDLERTVVFFVRYVIGLAGSLFVISVCKLMYERVQHRGIVEYIRKTGQNTMGIYIVQSFILAELVPRFHLDMKGMSWIVSSIVVAIVALWLCNTLVVMFRKITPLRIFILGEQNKK